MDLKYVWLSCTEGKTKIDLFPYFIFFSGQSTEIAFILKTGMYFLHLFEKAWKIRVVVGFDPYSYSNLTSK